MLKVLAPCDGLSGGKMAFDRLGIKTEYHAIEKNKFSRKISDGNFGNIIRWANDVDDVTEQDIINNGPFDVIMMGPICKSVSNASNGPGLKGSSKILFKCLEIRDWVLKHNPDAKWIIENVKMRDTYYKQFCDLIGCQATLINSALVSGQNRLRYYWTDFPVIQPKDCNIMLNDILEADATEGLGWSKSTRYKDENGKVHSAPAPGRTRYYEDRFATHGKANTLMASKHCVGQSTHTRVYLTNGSYRYLTLRECAKLQTIKNDYRFDMVSETQAFSAIGDGWTVDIIKHLIECMMIEKRKV